MALLSGVLQVLPYPIAGPVPVWRTAFCWIALAPLLKALLSDDTVGRALKISQGAALGYLSGFVWYLGNCYWIYQTMHLYGGISKPVSAGILVLFCLYLGLYHALFGALIVVFRRSRLGINGALLLTPFAWVAVELARARITSFPWDLLGITQVDNQVLTRIVPYLGAYGVSFIIAAVNAVWLSRFRLRERRFTRTLLLAGCCGILLLYTLAARKFRSPSREGTSAVATLVQQNIEVGALAANSGPPLTRDEMLQSFSRLSLFPATQQACYGLTELSPNCPAKPNPQNFPSATYMRRTDLIVWPEAPNDFVDIDPQFRAAMSRLAVTAHAPVIVGNFGVDQNAGQPRTYYNSADFIAPDGSFAGRYDKMHLVPFGEYVPYKNLLFFAGSLLQDAGNLEPGTVRTIFRTGGHSYGTFICYESVFGDEIRQFEDLGADVLVNISDDGWYGDTSAAWEHLNMVRMRAIENHRWVLRATNTGVTAAIDPEGRVVVSAPRHLRTSIQAGFDYEHDVTFYAAHGDLFAYLCAFITAVGMGAALLRQPASASA